MPTDPVPAPPDVCAACKRVIPQAAPYHVLHVKTGERAGERIPPDGVLCERCMARKLAPFIGTPVVLDLKVYD